jgi:hypothetical protein
MLKSVAFTLAMLLAGSPCSAGMLTFSFTDPVGDNVGSVDATGLTMTFDNATGDYDILFTATAAAPFVGDFRANAILFNPDTGSTAEDPSFFLDTFNDFLLGSPVTEIHLTGNNSRLLSWMAGDRVAASNIPFGSPDGGPAFRTNVMAPSGSPTELDYIGDSEVFATITRAEQAIPEPSSLALLAMGVTSLCGYRWRRMRQMAASPAEHDLAHSKT